MAGHAHRGASSARATVLPDWGIDTLTQRADAVVIGTVDKRGAVFDVDAGTIITRSFLTVERYLAGEGPDRLTLRQTGGQVGDRMLVIAGQPSLVVGERYLLFVRLDGSDAFLVAMERGMCHLVTSEDGTGIVAQGDSTVPVASPTDPAGRALHHAPPTCGGEALDPIVARILEARGAP